MSLEGLEHILGKKEVVPTVNALDLVERPEQVEVDYNRHVRTYVPISRAGEGTDGALNVEAFEKKVIKQVKEARAPRGYITAEYGYGKTSTALYLWQRAELENLVVVPPFQLLELPDLITAAFGWVRFRLRHSRPALIPPLEQLYQQTIDRSLEKLARERNISLAALQSLVQEQRLTIDLQPADYIRFFEEITDIVIQAGYEGLILLPDEIQQYIEPKLASKLGDPIAPFFNLVQGLATRAGYLRFGFIMVIPLKEIGVIREAKGRDDLLHRMKDLSLDLTNVYDSDFARRLWDLLATTFDFRDVQTAIVRPETLESLGQIASRDDISNGPRTVINVFRRMVELYLRRGHANSEPYTPINLVEDFMDEQAIQFSGNNKIRTVTRQALQSAIVQRDPDRYERAIKLAAAFPTDGVPYRIQKQYELEGALKSLMDQAIGELVMAVGPIDDGGITLTRLDRAQVSTDWLAQTIRDFRRAYGESHNNTRDRAITVFITLLKTVVFKNWRVVEERPSGRSSNLSIVFEGDYPSFGATYPKRRVQVRIFWEQEERKDDTRRGDVVLEYFLGLYQDNEDRRTFTQPAELYTDNALAMIPINLMYVRPEGVPLQIQQMLQGVWSPYDLSPLVLMNIYQMLEERRADNLIPKRDDQIIKAGFQPDILENIVRDLFNPGVGAPLGAAGIDVTERACHELLKARYGANYHTLMAVSNWSSSLQKYTAALDRLDNVFKKRGEIEVIGTKDQIAELMVLKNTGLESFQRTFSDLLEVVQDWTSRDAEGSVKFRLHPLETTIMEWLAGSPQTEVVKVGRKQEAVHILNTSDVFAGARELGYQNDEIDEIIKLLVKRELVEVYQQHLIRELPSQAPDIEAVSGHLRMLAQELAALLGGFPDNGVLLNMQSTVERWRTSVEEQLRTGAIDPQWVDRLGRAVQKEQENLRLFSTESQRTLNRQLSTYNSNLRAISDDRINAVNKMIEGSVIYVDQVNALRSSLQRHATQTKSSVQHTRSQLDLLLASVSRDVLTAEDLAQLAKNLPALGDKIQEANKQVEALESQLRDLSGWRTLVSDGSALYDTLQQMDQVTRAQADDFDRLARDIRADIISKANRLEALPNHSIYAHRLADIREEVRKIRETAQGVFTELQGRYRQALLTDTLYYAQHLDRPFEYNFSNPADSYRLLEAYMQDRLVTLGKKLVQLTIDQRQRVNNTMSTPLLETLATEDRERVGTQGGELLSYSDAILKSLQELDQHSQDISVIRDFPAQGQGHFSDLVHGFVEARDALGTLKSRADELTRWLTEFALTPEEEVLLRELDVEGLDSSEDLIEWRNRSTLSDDVFWKTVRSLYEKQRIRVMVTRVRR